LNIIEIFVALYAGQFNSVRTTLEGWRLAIRAEVPAENASDDSATEEDCKIYRAQVKAAIPSHGVRILCSAAIPSHGVSILCSAHIPGITNPAHYARNQARQQQAKEADQGQHLEKQLRSAAALIDVQAKLRMTTYVENEQFFLRIMDKSAEGGNDSYIVKTILRKNEAMLTAEEELLWARERFRADCAARAIRTCQDTERHYMDLHPHPGCARHCGEGT
jgi:hypothetical protein